MKGTRYLSTPRAVFILVNYLLGYNFVYPLLIESLSRSQVGTTRAFPYEALVYGGVFISTLIAGWPLIVYGWNRFVEEFKRTRKTILWSMALLYGVTIITTMIVYNLSGTSTSINQMEVEIRLRRMPYFVALIACGFAPVVEELVFRGCIFGKLKEKNRTVWGIIISSVMFGLLHVLSSLIAGDFIDVLNVIIYAAMGAVFSIIYYKTDSIVASMLVHLLNNAISVMIL